MQASRGKHSDTYEAYRMAVLLGHFSAKTDQQVETGSSEGIAEKPRSASSS